MILNTGSRTDIPAFFSPWFYNRIREGFVLARNPYNPIQVTRYRLTPELIDCLVFCTKNPAPALKELSLLDAFHQYWQVTITPYGKDVEPYVPPVKDVISAFQRLSRAKGLECVGWRYDPILIYGPYSLDFHIRSFEEMARAMEGYTDHCVISFVDLYQKTCRNFPGIRRVSQEERLVVGEAFAEIGRQHGIQIRTCCEGDELAVFGIDCSGCLTQAVIERAVGGTLRIPRMKPARADCGCLLGNDIGAYNTCGHGCLYCYANESTEAVNANVRLHNPDSPFLIGNGFPEDIITDARQESYFDGQLRLF